MNVRRIGALGVGLAVAAGLLTGCSAGSGGDDGPVTLTYWGWAPNMDEVIGEWNAANPDIQVKYTEAAGASDLPPKLLSAERAGNGPDMAQAEYQKIPSLVVSGVVQDITEQTESFRDEFSDGAWAQTTLDGATYAVPQDAGPMMMFYRKDLLAQYGVEAPTTWDEYQQAAETIHAADPSVYLGTLPQDGATFTGYVQQAGGQWWTSKGSTWTVDADGAESTEVGDYWTGLADSDVLYEQPYLTPEWNKLLTDGKMLSWNAGVWAPGVIENVAADTAGNWAAAPLPSFSADQGTGSMGGSAVLVTKSSEHAAEATKFLEWLNGSEEGSGLLASVSNLYPASTAGQEQLATAPVPALLGDQSDFYSIAAEASATAAPAIWGPNVQTSFDAFSDALAAQLRDGGSYADALTSVQKTTVDDLEKNGFDVSK